MTTSTTGPAPTVTKSTPRSSQGRQLASPVPELSVVVPVYNEEAVLHELARRLPPILDQASDHWELVLVNDGSRDRSWEIMAELREADDRIALVDLSRNFGHQLAITAGMDVARGDAVVVMDADLQDPAEVVLEMVAKWRAGFDVVYGVREKRKDESLFKRASAALFYRVLDALTPVQIPLDTGDFRLMSRRAIDALKRMPERARFVRGMVSWLGFRQTGVTFTREARYAGETKYPLRKMLAFAADGLVSFSTLPLRLATTLGFLMALASLVYLASAVVARLGLAMTVPGWTSIIAVVALIGSAQLICLGIIGEYVGRIYDEVKARPLYLVSTIEQGPRQSDDSAPLA